MNVDYKPAGAAFEFATAQCIIFGQGKLAGIGGIAREFGNRALVVTGSKVHRAGPLLALLETAGIECITCPVTGEPTVDDTKQGAELARSARSELVIGFGGGSALDAAKAIAALATNPQDVFHYLEVIGEGHPLSHTPLPCIAIPTTAGTGAEVTRNAVLASPSHRVKVSLRSPLMLPRVALVDSTLTHEVPSSITATTGMDALTQLIEPYVCLRANPLTDGLCREGIPRIARSLRRAFADGQDATARESMALASLFGGLALANAGLGAVHGFAAPLGGMFSAPHGAVCAALLPHVMQANLQALSLREPGSPVLARFVDIGRCLTGDVNATADEGVQWVVDLCRELAIPSLKNYGVNSDDVPGLIEKSRQASSMKANPVSLSDAELKQILLAAI